MVDGSRRDDAVPAARDLERWAFARGWRATDPYDGLDVEA